MTPQHIEALLDRSEAEHYRALGEELLGRSVLPPSDDELEAEGRGWLRSRWHEIAAAICASSAIQRVLTMPKTRERAVQLVAGVADVITGILKNVSPWTVSVIFVQFGVDQLCADRRDAAGGP